MTLIKPGGYALQLACLGFAPADGITYFIGSQPAHSPATTGGLVRVYIPLAGVIRACYIHTYNSGTLGTSETSTMSLRLNNTTDTTISAAVVSDATTNQASNTALGIAVVAGDYIELKWVAPTWSTNPGSIRVAATVLIGT